jgi:Holliday junction DNA helicase RuvA
MYAYLQGKFTYKNPALVYLDVQGVGYEVNISLNTYDSIRELNEGRLFTYLQVKEDAHTLFGFYEKEEKEMFMHLIAVSGVGATTARMMLSSLKTEELQRAIVDGDKMLLERIKGIGRKTAERIVLELRDKLSKMPHSKEVRSIQGNNLQQDALNALMALGIARSQAENSINKIINQEPSITKLEILIKKALQAI